MMLQRQSNVPHNRLTFSVEEEQAVLRVIRSGRWSQGEEVLALETEIAGVAGVSNAVGVGSGLGALRLALLALGTAPGSRIGVPAYSCVALANAVLALGAVPVPLEVEPETWVLSKASVAAEIASGRGLHAALAVHTFGCPAPVAEIETLGIPVIEDCSHGFGLEPLGRLGRMAILSLHATKLLGAGEGGIVLTNDDSLADRVRSARDYADKVPASWRLNDRMTDLTAALARCQLARLPKTIVRRAELAARYHMLLSGAGCMLPALADRRVWYRYAVSTADAEPLMTQLANSGIATARPVEDWCGANSAEPLVRTPVAARAYKRLLSLPLYPTLTESEQDLVGTHLVQLLAKGFPQ
jgi:perosamine synthetase